MNKKCSGPDHISSIEPYELNKMILAIRRTEKYLGSGKKIVTKSESENINLIRRSIIASRNINKGENFSEGNLTTKRPGYGISPISFKKEICLLFGK